MINFVICTDEVLLLNKCKNEIEKFMMQYDTDYKCHTYNEYGEGWKKYAKKEDGYKIYLLAPSKESISELDAAKLIREEYDDWTSMIVIIADSKKQHTSIEKSLMIIDVINKSPSIEKNLQIALTRCMKNYDNRPNTITYIYKNNIYNIDLRQIISIEKETDNKRCIIKTTTRKYPIPGTLNTIMKSLDNRFIKCYRNMIINLDQIENYYMRQGKIIFKNGETITAISRNQKKEIIKYIRGIRN